MAIAGPLFFATAAFATTFDPPPRISDRKVELGWSADADDPIFRGNTVVELVSTISNLHESGHAVRLITQQRSGSNFVSYAEGESAIRVWDFASTTLRALLDIPSGTTPTDLSGHGSGRLVLAALDDGRVGIWDSESGSSAPTQTAQISARALRVARFYPNSTDLTDLRMVTAGLDDTVRVMISPTTPLYHMVVRDGPTYALALIPAPNGLQVVAGGKGRAIRLWDLASPPVSPRLLLEGHAGPITDLVVTNDQRRLASADSTGQVRIWNLADGRLMATFETGQLAGPPRLGFSSPDGRIVFVALANGRLQLRSGSDGSLYREEPMVAGGISSFTMHADARRALLGGLDGRITVVRGGSCTPSTLDPVCFGGYKIWRSPSLDPADAVLLRSYNFDDSTWTFVGETRQFSDPDSIIPRRHPVDPNQDTPDEPAVIAGPHNGMPYYYSVTRFNRRYLNGAIFDELVNSVEDGFYRDAGAVTPAPIVAQAHARTSTPLLDQVYVIPNPYEEGKVQWESASGVHLEFRNLPGEAKISIFTVSGDLVRTIQHGKDRYGEHRASESWDLRNSSGRQVASGVYVYQVETPSGEVVQGYLTLVR